MFYTWCAVLGISTAIKTALKVALFDCFDSLLAPLNGQFMEKVNNYNRTKQINGYDQLQIQPELSNLFGKCMLGI